MLSNRLLNKIISLTIVISLLAVVLFFYNSKPTTPKNIDHIYQSAFSHLSNVLNKKKNTAINHLNQQKNIAVNIGRNPAIIEQFKTLNRVFTAQQSGSETASKIDYDLQSYFAYDLGSFYDLLFINANGDIFYTVKKEDDYHRNINETMFADLSLQKKAKLAEFSFIDYEYYKVSEEPASFYLSPVFDQNNFIGHIVLQLPINAINNIFTERQSLGQTGEVYLINENELMLTDSRFINTSSVLKKKIHTEAVSQARASGKGHKIIKDYRDKWVLSQFDSFQYEGVDWIIIAEMDEDEVLSDFYRDNEDYAFDLLLSAFAQNPAPRLEQRATVPTNLQKADVNEYIKSVDGATLYTKGVATCTAFAAYYPSRFGYLAHITPTDSIYNDGWLHQQGLADQYTNFIDNIINEIKFYELKPSELNELKFVFAAPDSKGLKLAIHKLLEQGFWLSQISVHHIDQSSSADLYLDYMQKNITTYWRVDGKLKYQLREQPTLAELLKLSLDMNAAKYNEQF